MINVLNTNLSTGFSGFVALKPILFTTLCRVRALEGVRAKNPCFIDKARAALAHKRDARVKDADYNMWSLQHLNTILMKSRTTSLKN